MAFVGFHVSKTNASKEIKASTTPVTLAIKAEVDRYSTIAGITRCAVQIFAVGPRGTNEVMTKEDKEALKKFIISHNDECLKDGTDGNTLNCHVRVCIHGAYIDIPWGKPGDTKAKPLAVHNVLTELRIAHEIGATGVVVHLGTNAKNDQVLADFLQKLNTNYHVIDDNAPILWLETNAAKPNASGDNTYETPAKIKSLFERVERLKPEAMKIPIGLCVDTAHLYSCGVSLDTYEAAQLWFDEVKAGLPDGTPMMIHLNDSYAKLGTGKDLHAGLTLGYIWKPWNSKCPTASENSRSGLEFILEFADEHGLDVICERNEKEIDNDLIVLGSMLC